MAEWRHMNFAPTDGTKFVAVTEAGNAYVMRHDGADPDGRDWWFATNVGRALRSHELRYWTPLPSALPPPPGEIPAATEEKDVSTRCEPSALSDRRRRSA